MKLAGGAHISHEPGLLPKIACCRRDVFRRVSRVRRAA
jgi:hypothetical protein